ncbi:unnamed protein product [Arctogadus glacialis]
MCLLLRSQLYSPPTPAPRLGAVKPPAAQRCQLAPLISVSIRSPDPAARCLMEPVSPSEEQIQSGPPPPAR